MASIELKPEYGFSLIEERLSFLTNDIGEMISKKELSEEAAKYLLNEFRNIANICRDYKSFEEEKNDSKTISFL